jgi:hypothetical protein
MQDPNEDTQWNDVLRSKGILPPKPKQTEATITEDTLVQVIFNNKCAVISVHVFLS